MFHLTKAQWAFALAVGILLGILIIYVASDFSWCVTNYPSNGYLHCMHFENSIYGRFVQP
jgi:hypothetical protein